MVLGALRQAQLMMKSQLFRERHAGCQVPWPRRLYRYIVSRGGEGRYEVVHGAK